MDSNHPKKGFADPCLPTWLPRLKNRFAYFPLYAYVRRPASRIRRYGTTLKVAPK
jgi:hypothetical protein